MIKKKIIIVCNSEFVLEKMLKKLVQELEKKFKVFCVLNYEKKNLQKILKNYDNLEIVNFQFPKNFSLFSIFSSIFNMIRIFKDIQPELIISCNRNSSFIARLCCFFYKAKFNVYIAFGFYFHDKQNKISFIFSFLLEKFLSIKNDLILSQSEYDTNLAKKYKIINNNKIATIWNGIDTKHFNKKNYFSFIKNNKHEELFYIVTTGRLVKNKGFQDLIYAVKELIKLGKDNIRLIIIGGKIKQDILTFEQQLKDLTKKLNLEKYVKFTGYTDNVAQELSIGDLFVLPSYREGFPTSLLEAMSMSLPVIATNIRGSKECLEDGVNGYLYEPLNIKDLVSKIFKIYNNKNILKRYSENSRKIVLEKFKIEKYVLLKLKNIELLIDEKL